MLYPYCAVGNQSVNYVLGTTAGFLLVCRDNELKWAAKCARPPVQVIVGNFGCARLIHIHIVLYCTALEQRCSVRVLVTYSTPSEVRIPHPHHSIR